MIDTDIRDTSNVSDIVASDYRTSYVFRKYRIDYCCGGRRPIKLVCEIMGLDYASVKNELVESTRVFQISSQINFNSWNLDFLIDYIMHVHHAYLDNTFPQIVETVDHFTAGHSKKYPYLEEVSKAIHELKNYLPPQVEWENQVMFPYIKQIIHAHESRETYASLLVRTLRKPLENKSRTKHGNIEKIVSRLRGYTNNYSIPDSACTTHRVAFLKLQELDGDIMQHFYLENKILFPKALALENELLGLDRLIQ